MKLGSSLWTLLLIFMFALMGATAFKLGEHLFKQESREPAAIKRTLADFSSLPMDKFEIQIQKYFKETLLFKRQANHLILSLGHALGPMRATSICNTYSEVEYELTADGFATHGEPTKLYITAKCEPSETRDQLEIAKLDIRKLVNIAPRDQNLSYSSKLWLETKNFPGEWPNEWTLTQVKLVGSKHNIILDSEELRQIPVAARTVAW